MVTRARLTEMLRFGMATAVSATITLGLPVLLVEFGGVPERRAVAIALAVAFVVNFVTTRRFVFRSEGRAGGELWRFALTSAGFRLAEYLAFLGLHSLGMVYFLAQALVLTMSFLLKFLVLRSFVYGDRKAT
jgi:putative flippase GtrA